MVAQGACPGTGAGNDHNSVAADDEGEYDHN